MTNHAAPIGLADHRLSLNLPAPAALTALAVLTALAALAALAV